MYSLIEIQGYSMNMAIERSKEKLFNAILMAKLLIRTIKSLKYNFKISLTNTLKVEE